MIHFIKIDIVFIVDYISIDINCEIFFIVAEQIIMVIDIDFVLDVNCIQKAEDQNVVNVRNIVVNFNVSVTVFIGTVIGIIFLVRNNTLVKEEPKRVVKVIVRNFKIYVIIRDPYHVVHVDMVDVFHPLIHPVDIIYELDCRIYGG